MKTTCLNEINENDFFEWIEWRRLSLELNKNHFFKWVEWKRFFRMKTTCSRFKTQRIVRALSIQSKNSMFKYVVLIELKISSSLNFELEIFNSIKTTYLKN
jgi:pimeloyl-CoA synthetase